MPTPRSPTTSPSVRLAAAAASTEVALDPQDHPAPMASPVVMVPLEKTELRDPTETMPLLEAARPALALQDPQALLDHADLVAPLEPQVPTATPEPLVPRDQLDLLEPQDPTETLELMDTQDLQVPQARSPPAKELQAPLAQQDQLDLRDHQDPLVPQETVEAPAPQDQQETQDPMVPQATLVPTELQVTLVPLVVAVLAVTAHHPALPLDSLPPKYNPISSFDSSQNSWRYDFLVHRFTGFIVAIGDYHRAA
jgi:hypothetical protein